MSAQPSLFKDPLSKIYEIQDKLKVDKSLLKEIVDDEPMELEELRLAAKDMQKQIKTLKLSHLMALESENSDYMDIRKRIQEAKEELAHAKLELHTKVGEQKKADGLDLDLTVQVNGMPFRLQTQGNTDIFINGKLLK